MALSFLLRNACLVAALVSLGFGLAFSVAAPPAVAGAFAASKPLPSDPPRPPMGRGVAVILPDQDPLSFVTALYNRPSPFLGRVSGYRRVFMPDLARAMAQDTQPPEQGAIRFDWRFGAPRAHVSDLQFEVKPTLLSAVVTARFRVDGQPTVTRIKLLKRRTGWRVHDIGQNAWSLRSCLKMRGTEPSPACIAPPVEPGINAPLPLTPAAAPKSDAPQPLPAGSPKP